MSDIAKPEPFVLPFWEEGAENSKLGRAAHAWFSLLARAASWGIMSKDPMTCDETALDLLAWERNVKRYGGEPERLYRLRVNYAYENGRDAGLVSGWKRIFKRLELVKDEGGLELLERMPGQDWDIVGIVVDDSAFPDLQNVLEIIIKEYGRSCRRYRFISRITQPLAVRCGTFDDDHSTVAASPNPTVSACAALRALTFDNDHATTEAYA